MHLLVSSVEQLMNSFVPVQNKTIHKYSDCLVALALNHPTRWDNLIITVLKYSTP
jgi:hypothetical protein